MRTYTQQELIALKANYLKSIDNDMRDNGWRERDYAGSYIDDFLNWLDAQVQITPQ